jgi:hypothetical protein
VTPSFKVLTHDQEGITLPVERRYRSRDAALDRVAAARDAGFSATFYEQDSDGRYREVPVNVARHPDGSFKARAHPRRIRMTYDTAMALGADEAERSMREGGRTAWSREDYNRAVRKFNKLHPKAGYL